MPHPRLALPDGEIAAKALRFNESRVPDFVHHHCIRSYLYARELAAQQGLRAGRDYDDDLLFLCNVLHDLGVGADATSSPERFEVHGADLAVEFAREAGVPEDELDVLWDAIALHTSPGIAHRKQPEVMLTHIGVATDIAGDQRDRLPEALIAAAHEHHPRADDGYALPGLIAEQARQRPEKAVPLSFPAHVVGLHPDGGAAVTWFDVVEQAGWGDRPVSEFAPR